MAFDQADVDTYWVGSWVQIKKAYEAKCRIKEEIKNRSENEGRINKDDARHHLELNRHNVLRLR